MEFSKKNDLLNLEKREKIRKFIDKALFFNEIGKHIPDFNTHKEYINKEISEILSKLNAIGTFNQDIIEFVIIPYYSIYYKKIQYHYFSPANDKINRKLLIVASYAKWILKQFERGSIYKLTDKIFTKFPERSIIEIEVNDKSDKGEAVVESVLDFRYLKDNYIDNSIGYNSIESKLLSMIHEGKYMDIKDPVYRILIPKEIIFSTQSINEEGITILPKTFNDNIYELINTISENIIDEINRNIKKILDDYKKLRHQFDENLIKAFVSMSYYDSVRNIYMVPAHYGSNVASSGIILFCKSPLELDALRFYRELVTKLFMNPSIKETLDKSLYYSIRSALAAVMSRNMSHNIGSHVLSNISLEEIQERKYDLSKFNSYLQQRMDFLARISINWPDTGEYLFFYTDLIKGFFKQSLLMDKIIKDDGINGKKIHFYLKINDKSICFNREEILHENEKECDHAFVTKENITKDLLIQLPGGLLGAQAFYIIIENIMRNSAKYNIKSGQDYNIYIEIAENNDLSYKVRIYDEFSINTNGYQLENGEKCTLVEMLQEKLQAELIKETGELTPKDWGIQEIKIAARFLNHPFKEKDSGIAVENSDGEHNYIWVEKCPPDLKDGSDKNGSKFAGYVFSIPKARLILCVDYPIELKEKQQKNANNKGVFFTKNEETKDAVLKFCPEILYLELRENETEEFEKFLGLVKEHINLFPTRIVISADSTKINELNEIHKTFEKENEIPPGRVVICSYKDIENSSNWEKFIVSVYKQWVFGWHKEQLMTQQDKPVKVGIVIYFERSEGVFSRWLELKQGLSAFGLDKIKLCFFSKNGHKENDSDFSVSNHSEECDVLLGFDNHGNIGEDFKKWDFYQVIGHDGHLEMNNHTIFDSLTNITPGFGGAMFVLSLIESAFTKVAIIDERAANATFEEIKGKFKFKNMVVRQENIIDANLFISASIWKDGKRHRLISKDREEKDFKLFQEGSEIPEGISENNLRFFTLKSSQDAQIKEQQVDVLVFHLGFLEEVFGKDKKKMEDWLEKLNKKVPKIVIISGRGLKPEEIPGNLPFKEASLISNHIISDLSKLHLVKGLISARGK